ncbi:hypothetical protein QEN19_003998 [Hanseniaspora menglaensis]
MLLSTIDGLVNFIFKFAALICLAPLWVLGLVTFKQILLSQVIFTLICKFIKTGNTFLNKKVYKWYNIHTPNCEDDLTSILSKKQVFCLVTGGSGGLGEALSLELLLKYGKSKNFNLIIVDKVNLKNELIENHDNVKFIHFDLKEDVLGLIEQLPIAMKDENSAYKILINNCGIRHKFAEFTEIWSEKELQSILKVNVIAGANLIEHLNPDYLVTVSSILSLVTPKNASLYSASKAAASAIHNAFVQIGSKKGLLILPGQLKDTSMFANIVNHRQFLAPLVDIQKLSKKIVLSIENLECSTIIDPFYGHFIALIDKLPYWLNAILRDYSEIDKASD